MSRRRSLWSSLLVLFLAVDAFCGQAELQIPRTIASPERAPLGTKSAFPRFVRGDANSDGEVTLSDPLMIVGCTFLGSKCPTCMSAADADDNGEVGLNDAIYILNFLFRGRQTPTSPFPTCGVDPTSDALDCASHPSCAQSQKREDLDGEKTPLVAKDRDGGQSHGNDSERPALFLPLESDADLSLLHYAAKTAPPSPESRFEKYEDGDDGDLRPTRSTTTFKRRKTPGFQWNSPQGRAVAAQFIQVDSLGLTQAPHATGDGDYCVEPDFYNGGSAVKPYGVTVKGLGSAFATEEDAYNFLNALRPKMPFYLPFRHPDVRLSQGYFYDSGTWHGSLDYGRTGVTEGEDATFGVYAMAPGVVVDVLWSDNGGNSVYIMHTAPDGTQYMSRHIHMRNGKDHDLQQALNYNCQSDKCQRVQNFAEDYPDHPAWGTNAHTIQVVPGQQVSAGQLIGWAGNSGVGGAGSGLNDDGSPQSPSANIHLHCSILVEHPSEADTFIIIDPYGVYGKADSDGCYDFLQDTPFARFFAPFYPTFHGLPIEVYSHYSSYYIDMGRTLQTRSIHRKDNGLRVSGSFQHGIPGAWRARSYMTVSTLQEKANQYYADGFIMRETNVVLDGAGNPRYNCIWRELEPGESIKHKAAMTPSQWSDNWQDFVVNGPYTVEDYFGYMVNGSERRSALYTTALSGGFYSHRNLTSSAMQDVFDQRFEEGYFPTSFSATEFPSGVRYSGMFHPVSGCWVLHWGLTHSQYQTVASSLFAKGYRLHRIQGYLNSTRYLAIFKRDLVNGGCP